MAKRTYDIPVRNAVARSGDPDLFLDLHIPRSTALQWIREGVKEVVTHPSLGKPCDALIEKALEAANRFSAKVFVPNLFADDGTENQNKDVDSLVEAGRIIRTIAQIDVEFSNSMIEALFRSLKHRWLFIISITSFEALCRAVTEYLNDHNNRIPHYALVGAVPLEVFSGTWTEKSKLLLTEVSAAATLQRIEFNRTQKCGLCPA